MNRLWDGAEGRFIRNFLAGGDQTTLYDAAARAHAAANRPRRQRRPLRTAGHHGLARSGLPALHLDRPADSPGRSDAYVKMLTPPGPTSNPTMIRTIPHSNCRRKIAKMPETTKMTANTHKIIAMVHLT